MKNLKVWVVALGLLGGLNVTAIDYNKIIINGDVVSTFNHIKTKVSANTTRILVVAKPVHTHTVNIELWNNSSAMDRKNWLNSKKETENYISDKKLHTSGRVEFNF